MKCYAGIGSRETPSSVLEEMSRRAEALAKAGYLLRSGHAKGADQAFEAGAQRVGGAVQIWVPWQGYNGAGGAQRSIRPSKEAMEMAAKFHPAWDKCSRGARLLHARNCHIVLGADLKSPVEFVLFWTKDGKASGGTGQGLRIAQAHGIRCELVVAPHQTVI